MESDKNLDFEIAESVDNDVSSLSAIVQGFKSIENQISDVNAELKELLPYIKNLQKQYKKESKIKKITKSKSNDKEVVSKLIARLSVEEVFKNKFSENDSLSKVKQALEHDMFFKSSNTNNVKIFADNKFTCNNYLGFSTLDILGFTKLIDRFYDAVDEYKTKYINDIIYNMNITPFNYQNIEYNLTNDLSNNMSETKLRTVFNSFNPIDSEYNKVPINIKNSLVELTGVDIEFKDISDDSDNVCIPFKRLNDLAKVCYKVIKDTRKKLFFSYLPYVYISELHTISSTMVEDFPSIETISARVPNMEDTYVILTADVERMISLVKKYTKCVKTKLLNGEDIDDMLLFGIELIYKDPHDIVISDKKFLQRINNGLERTLDLFINNARPTETSSSESD